MSGRPGPRRGLTFSPGTHAYRLDGAPVPGVTSILGVLDKPAIPRWAARTVAEHVADNPVGVETLRAMGRDTMVKALSGVPWERRDAAADRGTTFHALAERIVAGEEVDVPDSQVGLVESALEFMEAWEIVPVLTEAPVASREHRYAGTLDLIAGYRRPDTGAIGVGIFDWKSGKAIYPRFALQLAAYIGAEFHGLHGDERPVPRVDAAFGVHVRADGFDVIPLRHGQGVFEEFLAVRRVWEINRRVEGDWKRPGSGYAGVPIRAQEEESWATS